MEVKYTLDESDYLEYQLYTSSNSARIQRKKKKGWLLLTIGSIVAAIYFYVQDNVALAYYFMVTAIILGVFYPKYFNWRYKKHYTQFIKDTYKNRIGIPSTLRITDETIAMYDKTGEGRIKIEEIAVVNHTDKYLFAEVTTGASIIIPKYKVDEAEIVLAKLANLGIQINNDLKWKYK